MAMDENEPDNLAGMNAEETETKNLPAVIAGGGFDDEDPDAIEAKRRKRLEQFEQTHKAQTGFGAAANPEETGENAQASQDPDQDMTGERTLAGKIGHRALGVVTHKNSIGANPDSRGQISDRQLKAMIKVGVLEKGWDTLYFYDRAAGDIDPKLTGRANKILDTMQRRGEIPETISCSMKAQTVKPWQHFKGMREKVAKFKGEVETKKDQTVDSVSRPFREAAHGMAWKDSAKPAAAAAADSRNVDDQAMNGHTGSVSPSGPAAGGPA